MQRLEDSSIERVAAAATDLGYAVIPSFDHGRFLMARIIPTTDKYDVRIRRSNSNGWYIDCEAIGHHSRELNDIDNIYHELDSLKDKIIHTYAKEKRVMQNTKPDIINDYEVIKTAEYTINKNLKVITDAMYTFTKDDAPAIILDDKDNAVFFYAGEDHSELSFVFKDGEDGKQFTFNGRSIDLISDFKQEYLLTISSLLTAAVNNWISKFADFKLKPEVDREETIEDMQASVRGTRILIKLICDIVAKHN